MRPENFLRSPSCQIADEMAERYGHWPSELLNQAGGELNLNVLIFQAAAHRRHQDQIKAMGRRRPKSEADILIKIQNLLAFHFR